MRFLKRLVVLLLVVAILTTVIPLRPYEEIVADAEARRLQTALGNQCPLSEAKLAALPPEAIVLCGMYGLTALIDHERQGEKALRVYSLLGGTQELHTALATYGPKVIAVIDSYLTEGSKVAQLGSAVSNITDQLLTNVQHQWYNGTFMLPSVEKPEALTAEELAAYALLAILADGEAFLLQFTWQPPNGDVERKPVESLTQGAYTFLMKGVRNLETKAVTGQALTAYDYGGAALDVAIVFAGVKLLAKPIAGKTLAAKSGMATTKASKLAKLTAATAKAGKALTLTAKVGGLAALGTVGVLVYKNPLLLLQAPASAGRWIFESIGWSGFVGEFLGWLAVVAATLFILSIVTWPVRKTVWGAKLLYRATWPLRKLLQQLAQKAQAAQ